MALEMFETICQNARTGYNVTLKNNVCRFFCNYPGPPILDLRGLKSSVRRRKSSPGKYFDR